MSDIPMPTEYYTSRYSGEEIDKGIDAAMQLGGASTPQAALANLGAALRTNLLDNWYFGDPVNQRAETSIHANGKFLIDRWKIYHYESGTASLTAGGISLNGNFDFGITLESEKIPNIPNQAVTISVLLGSGELITKTGSLTNDGQIQFISVPLDAVSNLQFIRNWESGKDLFFFQMNGSNVAPIAAKLELGLTQTLAYQDEEANWQLFETPDYAAELSTCQRYQIQLNPHLYNIVFIGDAYRGSSGGIWYLQIPLNTAMRLGSPSFIASDNTIIMLETPKGAFGIQMIGVHGSSGTSITFSVKCDTVPVDVVSGAVYAIDVNAPPSLLLDANL